MACRKCAKGAVRMRAGTATGCGRAMAGRIIGVRNPPRKDMAWPPVTPLAEVSTGTAISPITKMARKPDAILMVIARLPRTALLLQAARVLLSGKPTMDSRGILLALDLENSKRPCADYGGGSGEGWKDYSHGTVNNEKGRLGCGGSKKVGVFFFNFAGLSPHCPFVSGLWPPGPATRGG